MIHLQRLIPALFLIVLTACGGGADGGTWKLDGAATTEANRATLEKAMEGQPEEAKKAALGMLESMFSNAEATMILASDGTLTGTSKMVNPVSQQVQETQLTGTWTQAGDTVTMTTREGDSGKEETQVGVVSGSTMTIVLGEGADQMTMVFEK